MVNLIRLELKKYNLKNVIKGLIITNIIFLTLGLAGLSIATIEKQIIVEDFSRLILFIDNMTRTTFVIYSSIILASLTIEEYRNKTINVMFMYPINRMKIFISKIVIAMVFAFVNIMFSNGLLILVSGLLDKFILDIIPGSISLDIIISNAPSLTINAIAASGMVLISLFFGMKKKSLSAMITTSFIVVAIMCSNNNGYSLSNCIPIVILVGIVGVIIGVFTLKNIENKDIL